MKVKTGDCNGDGDKTRFDGSKKGGRAAGCHPTLSEEVRQDRIRNQVYLSCVMPRYHMLVGPSYDIVR
jgi:hypothetical protein